MANPIADTIIMGSLNPVEGKVVSIPNHKAIDEKLRLTVDEVDTGKEDTLDTEIKTAPSTDDGDDPDKHFDDNAIIVTGADAANHLLPLRDDGDPALTFRSLFLGTCLSAFQAVMSQIYTVS